VGAGEWRERPFEGEGAGIGTAAGGERVVLEPLGAGEAEELGLALAAIDPWAAYRATPAGLARFFAADEAGSVRRAIRLGAGLAGIIVVQRAWLHGPYLQFLGLLPGHQGRGVGGAVLGWLEAEARRAGARNVWLCVSATNARARAFYERHGYSAAAAIDALAADHIDEVLMRKRLGGRAD
jgi:ribosomal protein S18 acetylase RimI-like enzyme